MTDRNTDSEYYHLCQFVVQPRVVLPMRATQYNVAHVMGLHFDGCSETEGMTVKSEAEGIMAKNEFQITVESSVLEIVD